MKFCCLMSQFVSKASMSLWTFYTHTHTHTLAHSLTYSPCGWIIQSWSKGKATVSFTNDTPSHIHKVAPTITSLNDYYHTRQSVWWVWRVTHSLFSLSLSLFLSCSLSLSLLLCLSVSFVYAWHEFMGESTSGLSAFHFLVFLCRITCLTNHIRV